MVGVGLRKLEKWYQLGFQRGSLGKKSNRHIGGKRERAWNRGIRDGLKVFKQALEGE